MDDPFVTIGAISTKGYCHHSMYPFVYPERRNGSFIQICVKSGDMKYAMVP